MYVLDKGEIHLEEAMGGDPAIIEAARVCWQTQAQSDSLGTYDQNLIHKLMEMEHGTPFEHAVLRWRVRCPIFVARQWLRHRAGVFNERSLRYTTASRVYYIPLGMDDDDLKAWNDHCDAGFDLYERLVKKGMKKEKARGILGLNTYTEFVWTVNARSFMNWLKQRTSAAAQEEHRVYAQAAYVEWERVMPITAQAWRGYNSDHDPIDGALPGYYEEEKASG